MKILSFAAALFLVGSAFAQDGSGPAIRNNNGRGTNTTLVNATLTGGSTVFPNPSTFVTINATTVSVAQVVTAFTNAVLVAGSGGILKTAILSGVTFDGTTLTASGSSFFSSTGIATNNAFVLVPAGTAGGTIGTNASFTLFNPQMTNISFMTPTGHLSAVISTITTNLVSQKTNEWAWGTPASPRLVTLSLAGVVSTPQVVVATDLTISASSISQGGGGALTVGTSAGGQFNLRQGGINRMNLDASGNVNIVNRLSPTNGIGSYATNIVAAVANTLGETNITGAAEIWNISGTSGTFTIWMRSGVGGSTVCGVSHVTNTVIASGGDYIIGPNCGIQFATAVGTVVARRAF